MVITDRYDHLIDEKSRLAIPSEIRAAMDPELDGEAFYLVPAGRYLQMVPEKLYQQLAQTELSKAGLVVDPKAAALRRLVCGMVSKLVPDKQGRVVIPDRFLADQSKTYVLGETRLGRQVSLLGVGDRVELWDRADLDAHCRELMANRPLVEAAGLTAVGSMPGGSGPF